MQDPAIPQPLVNKLLEATLQALDTLREVMNHATVRLSPKQAVHQSIPDQPLPRSLNQARIAAAAVLRLATRVFAPATAACRRSTPAALAHSTPSAQTVPSLPVSTAPALGAAARATLPPLPSDLEALLAALSPPHVPLQTPHTPPRSRAARAPASIAAAAGR